MNDSLLKTSHLRLVLYFSERSGTCTDKEKADVARQLFAEILQDCQNVVSPTMNLLKAAEEL